MEPGQAEPVVEAEVPVDEVPVDVLVVGAGPTGRPAPQGGPRAGDRLPDGPLTRDGRPRWLHESLRGPGFHLLLCGPAEAWEEAGPGVLRDDGTLLRRLGVATTAHYLVRPDGHVGYRAAGTDLDGLKGHLRHWLPGAAAVTRAP